MEQSKDKLSPAELVGFSLLVEKHQLTLHLVAICDTPEGRILATDKLYLAEQHRDEAERAIQEYLGLCGVPNDGSVRVMPDGTFEPVDSFTGPQRVAQMRAKPYFPPDLEPHPEPPGKEHFPLPGQDVQVEEELAAMNHNSDA